MTIYDRFGTIQYLQRALDPQTSNWSGTIFDRILQQTGSQSKEGILPERIDNPITTLGLSAMFTFQLDNTKR